MNNLEARTSAERMLMLWGKDYTCRHVDQMIYITESNPRQHEFWKQIKSYVDLTFKERVL